ncbi:cysteine proteinase, partial [Saccharata proteae CBS 121410]
DAFPDPRAAPASIFVVVVLGAIAVYHLLNHLDIPLRAIPEILWNHFVYLVPSTLVFKLGQPTTAVDENSSEANMFAAKNEVLRKAFGFEGNGIFKAMAGDRTLRGLGTLLKNSNPDRPAGLGNWDNSCYQNSVIQGLASLPSLEAFLSQVVSRYGKLEDDSTNGALLATILKLNDPDNHGTHLWTPAKLKSMSSWQQQDAQEYFSKVLDEVDREILKASKEVESQQAAGLEGLASQGESAEGGELRNTKDLEEAQAATPVEPLRNPLEGLLAQRVGCMTCGFTEGLSMIPFNCLTVPLDTAWNYDIKDCLNEYTKLEPIEGVECAKCTLLKFREQLHSHLTTASELLREHLGKRLEAVQKALDEEDFSDSTLAKECKVPKKEWVTSTKSRQAVVARAPKSLIVHVNRSVFDEMTGAQRKNLASVSFPKVLDLQPWSLGNGDVHKQADGQISESWSVDPAESMLSHFVEERRANGGLTYGLRAVVTHYGRHENGHYICYRKHPFTAPKDESGHDEDKGCSEDFRHEDVEIEEGDEKPAQESERWWRLSDEDVSPVTEEAVLAQGGVFMLFYERLEP